MSVNPEDMFDQSLMVDETQQTNGYLASRPNQRQQNQNQQQNQSQHQRHQQQIRKRAPLKRCRVLLKQHSKLNKRIIEYFKENIQILNSKGFSFEWIPVYEEEMEFYEEQNITKFPVLIINVGNIVGVSNIISKLHEFCTFDISARNAPEQFINKEIKRDASEDVRDYFMSEMNRDDKAGDDENDVSNDLSKRASEMLTNRKSMGQHTISTSSGNPEVHETSNKRAPPQQKNNNPASTSTVDIVKSLTDGSKEDEMMAAFWENQETTDI